MTAPAVHRPGGRRNLLDRHEPTAAEPGRQVEPHAAVIGRALDEDDDIRLQAADVPEPVPEPDLIELQSRIRLEESDAEGRGEPRAPGNVRLSQLGDGPLVPAAGTGM